MNEMVKRVAKALQDAVVSGEFTPYEHAARVAIAAMREPTDAMLDAVENHPDHTWENPRDFEDEFRTAIDAALTPDPSP